MKYKCLLLSLAFILMFSSQIFPVSIYLSNGMKIQTWVGTTPTDSSGFGRIVVDGDVYDAPNPSYTGELLGKASCSNANATTFAGLTLPAAAGGTVTRLDVIACGYNTPPANFTRYFVIKNNGSAQTGTMTFSYKSSNVNGVTSPYAISRWNGSTWTDYLPNSITSPITANNAQVPNGTSLWIAIHDQKSDVYRIYAKLWLEGTYSTATDKMSQKVNFKALLDTLKRDWTVGYLTSDVTTPLTTALPTVVDFIHVMIRSTATGTMVAEAKGLVNTDGYLYALDGTPGVPINATPQDYYLVVMNHNHLPVMSNRAVMPSEMTGYPTAFWDFTNISNCYPKPNPYTYNEPVKQIDTSPVTYGLWGGNAAGNGGWESNITGTNIPKLVFATDRVGVRNANGIQAYLRGDVNMDGVGVYATDIVLVRQNNGSATEVPFPVKP